MQVGTAVYEKHLLEVYEYPTGVKPKNPGSLDKWLTTDIGTWASTHCIELSCEAVHITYWDSISIRYTGFCSATDWSWYLLKWGAVHAN
jgi:hypothetical protein